MGMDALTRSALRTPMGLAGVLMVVVGMIPLIAVLISGWNGASGVIALSAFAPIGATFMALARSRAAGEAKQGR